MAKGILEANKQLKKAFAGSYLFGFICVLIVSISNNIPSFFLLILGIIPVFYYIGYGSKLSAKHKDDIGFSDSVYYLGFVLTLTSLFFAVVNERIGSGTNTEMTLQYFGYALATTIIGIIYRTYHNQFLYDEQTLPKGEAERISSEIDSFSASMNDLKKGINELSSTVSNDLPIINRDLKDGYKQLGDNIKELAQSTSDSKSLFTNSMVSISQPMAEAIKKLSEDLNSQDVTIDRSIFYELETNLKKVNDDFSKAVMNISTHLSNQKIDESLFTQLSKNFNSINGKFEEMNNKFDQIIQSYTNALHSMNTNNLIALQEVKKLNKDLENIKNPSLSTKIKRFFYR